MIRLRFSLLIFKESMTSTNFASSSPAHRILHWARSFSALIPLILSWATIYNPSHAFHGKEVRRRE